MSLLNQKHLQDEEAAYAWVEARVWPNGPVCPHCGEKERVGKMRASQLALAFTSATPAGSSSTSRSTPFSRPATCRCTSGFKPSISSQDQEGHFLESAPPHSWRHSQDRLVHGASHPRSDEDRKPSRSPGPIGGKNKIVEADDTYVGGKAKNRAFREPAPKKSVLSLVERGGDVRSFHVPAVSGENLGPIIEKNVKEASIMMTDEAKVFEPITARLELTHKTVNHSRERICPRRGLAHQHRRELFLDPEARDCRRLSACQRAAFAPLPCGIRFPL